MNYCAITNYHLIKESGLLNITENHSQGQSESSTGNQKQIKLDELPLFDFRKVEIATNNFDTANKLGQGGFGPVYKVIYSFSVCFLRNHIYN